MIYFLKCCSFQELGSVDENGKAKRGRYLMSSMNKAIVDFFPALSMEIPNDTALLPVIPLYTRTKTYVNYVYHNSKYTGTLAKNPRNEYRIYLNNEIEDHQLYFSAEDIVVMRKNIIQSNDKSDVEQLVYYIDVVKDHSSGTYLQLSKIIEKYPTRGGYGMYEGELDFFEKQVQEYEASQQTTDIYIDKSVTEKIKNSTDENKVNLFNPATFRDFVLAGYGNSCAVTGQYAKGIQGDGIDVVYIMPKHIGGTCMPSNGIALSNRLSLSFVRGEFTLTDRFEIMVHPNSKNELLFNYHLKQILVPANLFFQPDKTNLKYHRENIYGSFNG